MKHFFREVENGPLQIWDPPLNNRKYVIGIDASTGVSQDYTAMQVLCRTHPFTQAAMFRAKWSITQCAKFASILGTYYNQAMLIVETQRPGNAIQDGLIETYRYQNCYQSEDRNDENPHVSTKYGFCTTEAKKWMLIREMQQAITDNDIIIQCKTTIEEMMNFVYREEKTKTGAAAGSNDDTVMAIMLALHAAILYPQVSSKPRRNPYEGVKNPQEKAMMNRFVNRVRAGNKKKEVIIA